MMKKNKFKLILGICLSSVMLFSCGQPTESMADFIKRTCDKESYDCDCYSKKVKSHFKTEEKFAEWKESSSDEYPEELIKLKGECSKDVDFDF